MWNYWKQSKRYCKVVPHTSVCPIECWKCNMLIHVCLHTVAVWWVWQFIKVPINKVDPHPNFYDHRAKVLQQNIFERRNISDMSVYNTKLKTLLWTNVLYVLKSLPWNISQHLLIKPSIVQRPGWDILDRGGEYLENLWTILEKCLWMYSDFWMSHLIKMSKVQRLMKLREEQFFSKLKYIQLARVENFSLTLLS